MIDDDDMVGIHNVLVDSKPLTLFNILPSIFFAVSLAQFCALEGAGLFLRLELLVSSAQLGQEVLEEWADVGAKLMRLQRHDGLLSPVGAQIDYVTRGIAVIALVAGVFA